VDTERTAAVEGRVWSAPPWSLAADEVAAVLETDPVRGLTDGEARRRVDAYGPNELHEEPRTPRWRMFLGQFANTLIVVLLVAAFVTTFVGDARDTVVIMIIVVLNAVLGFVQESRAEEAMAALKGMTAPHARVVRGGVTRTIPAREVAPGDVLRLEPGDVLAADARLSEAPSLRVNEAALTGESVPVDKSVRPLARGQGELLADRQNMVFKGTAVVLGRATAIVTETGMRTTLGEIAGLLQAHEAPQTPLQRRLAVLGRRLAAAAAVVCAAVFVVGVARGEPADLMFLTAVSLAVAAIPEALPAVATIALALGAQRMAKRNALVRKLPAVETLGSVTVVCSDKTGTLTQGRMLAERVWTAGGEVAVTGFGYEPAGGFAAGGAPIDPVNDAVLLELLLACALCNDAWLVAPRAEGGPWEVTGDPTEGALAALAGKAGFDRRRTERSHPRVSELPFDASRKRMTTVHEDPQGGFLVASKGALEAILPAVDGVAGAGPHAGSASEPLAEARRVAESYARGGYRVLAIAGARLPSIRPPEEAERDLLLYGLVAMADPPRPESPEAVAACRAAGLLPVMITGDHPATARSVAAQVGVLDDRRRVMTGAELSQEGAEGLARHVADVAVYARTTPEQKLDIVKAWKARGDVVAMTGDGANDAPALRLADIGVAMGITGTDVSKEAADMVLADDDFATIVSAVREGRRIYDNIRRFVRYMLTANSGEIWVMLLGPFLGMTLPLLPIQILWINLVTDGAPAVALGVEPAERDAMARPPRPPGETLFAGGIWQHILVVGLLMGAIPLALGVWGRATGRPWQTMVFTSLACSQLFQTLALRSERRSFFSLGLRSNPFLSLTVVGTLAVQIAVIYWPPMRRVLHIGALSATDLLVVLAASTIVFWAVELEKLIRRWNAHRRTR
jgi:Ca2+-transporting ATPase